MNFDAAQKIQKELEPGEKLLWTGQPAQGIRWRCKLFCVNEKAPFGSERTKRVKGAVGAPLRPGAIFAKEL